MTQAHDDQSLDLSKLTLLIGGTQYIQGSADIARHLKILSETNEPLSPRQVLWLLKNGETLYNNSSSCPLSYQLVDGLPPLRKDREEPEAPKGPDADREAFPTEADVAGKTLSIYEPRFDKTSTQALTLAHLNQAWRYGDADLTTPWEVLEHLESENPIEMASGAIWTVSSILEHPDAPEADELDGFDLYGLLLETTDLAVTNFEDTQYGPPAPQRLKRLAINADLTLAELVDALKTPEGYERWCWRYRLVEALSPARAEEIRRTYVNHGIMSVVRYADLMTQEEQDRLFQALGHFSRELVNEYVLEQAKKHVEAAAPAVPLEDLEGINRSIDLAHPDYIRATKSHPQVGYVTRKFPRDAFDAAWDWALDDSDLAVGPQDASGLTIGAVGYPSSPEPVSVFQWAQDRSRELLAYAASRNAISKGAEA